MKKNLFFSILLLTSISHFIVAMEKDKIVTMNNDKIVEKDNDSEINPFDTVNNPFGQFYNSPEDYYPGVIPDQNNNDPKKKSVFNFFTNSVINIYNNSTNKLAKITGFKDITNESMEYVSSIMENTQKITTLEDFTNDYKNHSITSDTGSFVQKVIARKSALDTVISNMICEIVKNKNNSVEDLRILNQKNELKIQYDKVFNALIQSQINLLNEDFINKSNTITQTSISNIKINTQNNENDKDDNENK